MSTFQAEGTAPTTAWRWERAWPSRKLPVVRYGGSMKIAEDGPGDLQVGPHAKEFALDLRYGSNKRLARAQHYRETA